MVSNINLRHYAEAAAVIARAARAGGSGEGADGDGDSLAEEEGEGEGEGLGRRQLTTLFVLGALGVMATRHGEELAAVREQADARGAALEHASQAAADAFGRLAAAEARAAAAEVRRCRLTSG